jgi:hypothetical protein
VGGRGSGLLQQVTLEQPVRHGVVEADLSGGVVRGQELRAGVAAGARFNEQQGRDATGSGGAHVGDVRMSI